MNSENFREKFVTHAVMPRFLSTLPKDSNGLPIPFLSTLRAKGQPYSMIDPAKWESAFRREVCGLCGKELSPILAFIGGPLNLDHRYFKMLPMHVDCAEYALKVCPYMVYENYAPANAIVSSEQAALVANRPSRFLLGTTLTCTSVLAESGDWWANAGRWVATSWWKDGGLLLPPAILNYGAETPLNIKPEPDWLK
jgi:hypothetical protein